MGQPRNEVEQHGVPCSFEYPAMQLIGMQPPPQQTSAPAPSEPHDSAEALALHWNNNQVHSGNQQRLRDNKTSAFTARKHWSRPKGTAVRSPRQSRKYDEEENKPALTKKQPVFETLNEEDKVPKSHSELLCAPYPTATGFCQQPFASDLVTYQPYQLLYHAPQQQQLFKRKPRPLQPWEEQRPFNPSDRFLARAHLLCATETPKQLLTGGQWDKLSQGVWDMYVQNQQSEKLFRRKMAVWKNLFLAIKKTFPRWGLYLVGSTMTGLATNFSDVDMCLVVRQAEMDQRHEAVFYLQQVLCNLWEHIDSPNLIQAKVPILKFCDVHEGIEIDLNCNNAVGIRNTHLLYCYTRLDWRVRPLVLIVKLWAQIHGINDAKNMTLSSYSLALMVINFLQCGVSPSVLPCLQAMYPEKFNAHSVIHSIDIHEELPPCESSNKQTLGELLLGFLEYYSTKFDYVKYAVSVRTAGVRLIEDCRKTRTYKNDPHQWKYICIEEPFELTNTARSVYDPGAFERVKSVFVQSWLHLQSDRSLGSLFASID